MGKNRIPLNIPLSFDDIEIIVAAAYKAPFGFAVWQGDPDAAQTTELTLKFINEAGAVASPKEPADLINRPMSQALPEVVGTPLETGIREILQRGGESQVLVRTAQPGEEVRTFKNKIARIADDLVLATFDEITEQVLLEREFKVERRTNLATRAYFDDVFEELVRDHQKVGGSVGLLFIDLDKFKLINDTFGHICGDEILSEVARRLRMLDPQPRLIARWGGDEFAILTRWGAEQNRELAETVLNAFKEPVVWGKEKIQVHISVGVTTSEGVEKINPRLFMLAVDTAMYKAKHQGGGIFQEATSEPV
jgi:diguanylate cyclase (GGDEF)-like protein